jgi:peptidoglycan/xylan/chitin deacetylase (PgdA/CDA1 family)
VGSLSGISKLQSTALWVSSPFSPVIARRLLDSTCLLPYYHVISDDFLPHVAHLYKYRSVHDFEKDIDFFLSYSRPISLEEFVRAVRETGRPPTRSFLLSFDDGFSEMHDIVRPLLLKKGVPAVFFVTAETLNRGVLCFHQKISLLIDKKKVRGNAFPDAAVLRILRRSGIFASDLISGLRAISWRNRNLTDEIGMECGIDFAAFALQRRPYLSGEQIRSLSANGFSIGSHSIDHPVYKDLSLSEQLRQTSESTRILSELIGVSCKAFAFPHGDSGVPGEFFNEMFTKGSLEVSFGTSAPGHSKHRLHFQRFSMEKDGFSPELVINRYYLRERRNVILRRLSNFANGV